MAASGIRVRRPAPKTRRQELADEESSSVAFLDRLDVTDAAGVADTPARIAAEMGAPAILGMRVRTPIAAYAASKAALVQLTQPLALESAEHGIWVNDRAGLLRDRHQPRPASLPVGQEIVARIPLQRVGQTGELDGPLLLLASDASSYMTGAVIPVDGGHVVSRL